MHAKDSAPITSANPAAEQILGLTADRIRWESALWIHGGAQSVDGAAFAGEDHPAMVTLRGTGLAQTGVVMGMHKPDGRADMGLDRLDDVS